MTALAAMAAGGTPARAGFSTGDFHLDVVVNGGTASSADFVHDLVMVAPQATGIVDPSDSQCDVTAIGGSCSSTVTRPSGTYTVDATSVPADYTRVGFSCVTDNDGAPLDVTSGNSFELGRFALAPTLCTVRYDFVAPTTTTTPTTTTVPETTTTVVGTAPATTEPATTQPATTQPTTTEPVAVLPASGLPSTGPTPQTLPIALVALAFLAAGTTAAALARRP